MTRARRPEDWERDLAAARAAEAEIAAVLAADERVENFRDHTADFDRLDYSFEYGREPVAVDLKEKIRRTSSGLALYWPQVAPGDIFVLDETVYRRIVWQGGGGYLVVHDRPGARWVVFGPWELTLGPRARYRRWGRRAGQSFAKGKIMLDLSAGAVATPEFSVSALLEVIDRSRRDKDALDAVEVGQPVADVGAPIRWTPTGK